MRIKEATTDDLLPLLELYTQLHGNDMAAIDHSLEKLWADILVDKNHHVIIGTIGGSIVSSCVLNVIPNLTIS